MTCCRVQKRLSALRDGQLSLAEERAVLSHLDACPACAERWRSLGEALRLLRAMPRVSLQESQAGLVLDRIDIERRGAALSVLVRPYRMGRPFMLPHFFPAVLMLVPLLAAAAVLGRGSSSAARGRAAREVWDARLPASGTEGNPLFPSSEVKVPTVRSGAQVSPDLLAEVGEGSFFLETVVARDGSVSTVTLLDGDSEQARPLLDALRHERFEPTRLRGRPVAVSVYRLISRMEVRAPLT